MLFYHTDKEYFENCIIYNFNNNNDDDTYYKYGALQLLYLYFTSDDKELIMNTYNDKISQNALNLSHSVNLNKLSRNMKNYGDKKINLANMNSGDSEWAKCYFTEKISTKQREDIKESLADGQVIDNNLYFNRIDQTTLCNNITKFMDNDDSTILHNGIIKKKPEIILLKISLVPLEISSIQPNKIQIDNIRVVKYNNNKITEYNTENYFIEHFFKLNIDNGLFMPIKKTTYFYKFNNMLCNDLYQINEIDNSCFSISQLGFESIKFLNDNAQFLDDNERDIDENLFNCEGDLQQEENMDMVKSILKNRLLDNSRKSYNRCNEKIRLTQAQDRDLRKHRKDKCVKKNIYGVEHCKYKSNCIYHNIYCNYEVERANINRFKTLLNDSKDISDIETVDNMFIVEEDSTKAYDICDKYISLDDTFDNKYNKIKNLKTMKDSSLNNFDNNSELYVDFEMLKYVSQDNSIYIFIDNK